MKKIFQAVLLPVAAGLLLVFSTGCTAGMKEAYHLRRAGHYYNAGQFDQAEIEYLNVVRNNPQNFLAISRLGEIYYVQGRVQNASQFLFRAGQLNTNDLAVRVRLGQLYQAAGKVKTAREEAIFVLDRQPQNGDAIMTLAESSVTTDEVTAARAYLNRLPPSANQPVLAVALGVLSLRERDFKTALASFQRAQTLDPKCGVAWSALGVLYQQQNQLQQAETAFKTAADLSPPRSNLRLNYANFEIQSGHPEVADAFLAETLKQTPDFVSAWILRAEIAITEKKYSDCATYLNGARALDPDDYQVALLDSQLNLAQGDAAKARAQLERLAHGFYQIPRVHYLLALTQLQTHEVNAAIISLNRALSLDTNFTDAGLLLAEIQIKNGTPDPAVAILRQLVSQAPTLIQARLLLADAYRAQKKPELALPIYESMEKTAPQNAGISLLKGFAYLEEQSNAPARQAFSRALGLAPQDLRVLDAIVRLDLLEQQFAPALQLLENALTNATNNSQKYELQLMVAKVFESQGKTDQTMAALEAAVNLNPDAPAARLMLAQYYLKDQAYPKALAELQAILQKNGANLSAWMLKGQIFNQQKNYQAAADAYEQMLVIDPQSSLALNNLAYLYSQYLGQVEKAYQMAKKARDLQPFEPSTADTLGWVIFHRGDYSTALGFLEESLRKLPGSADVQFHYGKTCYMLGREAVATTALKKALQLDPNFEGHEECQRCLDLLAMDPASISAAARASLEKRIVETPDDPVALRRLAAVYKQSGEYDRAAQIDEAILKANPNNLSATLDLARLYAVSNPAKALAMAKNAYAAAPQNPEATYLLGHMAWQSGNYKWALSLLKASAQGQSGNPNVQFDLARANYSMGKVDDARASFQQALNSGLSGTAADQARQWLDLMAAADQPALARAASSRSESGLKADPDNVPALMVSALISEQKSDLNAAAQAYARVLGLYPDFIPAQKKLAMVYGQNPAHTQEAYALALKARKALPDDTELPRLLGLILCQQGDYQQAINYLSLSASTYPNDAVLFYNLGLAQYHLKYFTDGKTSLKRAVELKLSDPLAADAKRMLQGMK